MFSQTAQYVPEIFTPVPIAQIEDGYSSARLAAQSWDVESYLVSTTGVYEVRGRNFSIVRGVYDFVSGNQSSYLTITVYSTGEVDNLAPAAFDGSLLTGTPYLPENNLISERHALENTWRILGEQLDKKCGPIDRIIVRSWTTYTETRQLWDIIYWSDKGILADLAVDSISGEIVGEPNVNESICAFP